MLANTVLGDINTRFTTTKLSSNLGRAMGRGVVLFNRMLDRCYYPIGHEFESHESLNIFFSKKSKILKQRYF